MKQHFKEIYPKDYWKKKYDKKTKLQRYWHGAKFAYRNQMLIRWHIGMLRLWIAIKFKKF